MLHPSDGKALLSRELCAQGLINQYVNPVNACVNPLILTVFHCHMVTGLYG